LTKNFQTILLGVGYKTKAKCQQLFHKAQ